MSHRKHRVRLLYPALAVSDINKDQVYNTQFPIGDNHLNNHTNNVLAMLLQSCKHKKTRNSCRIKYTTVVPALGDPRRERPPAVCGHFGNVPTHFKVKLPVISGHLPNADADSRLLVVSTCYNGQCKQMPRFRWSFQPKSAGAHPNLRPTDLSNL